MSLGCEVSLEHPASATSWRDIPELARRLEATCDDDAVGLADLARRLNKARWSPY